MFPLRSLFQQHRDVSLKLARHVLFSNFEGHQSVAKGKQTDAFLTLANPTAVHKNMIFSPLLMQLVLGLMTAGSAGRSRDELLSFLKSNSTDEINYLSSQLVDYVLVDASPNGGPRLCAANSVWVDQCASLKPSFTQIVDNVYKATCLSVDFASKPSLEVVNQVNQWAEKETAGVVNEILPVDADVNHLTRLIFANSLYFKGIWSEKFNASMTKKSKFHLLNGTSVQVPFMTCQSKRYAKAYQGFKVLRLPYTRGLDRRHFSMFFFLPDSNDGLPGLVEKVTSDSEFLERHLPYEKVGSVREFRIPKFKISFGFEASQVLKGLGVVSPFSGHALTEMVETKGLFVDSIFHKTVIEVDEEGSKAATATTSEVGLRSRPGEKVDFIADHPFLFLIREDGTGVLLFAGSILNILLPRNFYKRCRNLYKS